MNATSKTSKPGARPSHREKGIALITVLSVLTLAAVLVMAFFSVAQNELTSSTVYSRGLEAQQLSKTAVDMVMHQIRAATQKGGHAWASQPGMIRAWDTDEGFKAGYKLYSDDEMVEEDFGKLFDDQKELVDWEGSVVYTDLNAPVIRQINDNTRHIFPILDPRAKNPGAPVKSIEGFDFNERVVGGSFSEESPSLPMPVKWIYQLEDGSLGTLVGGGSTGRFEPLESGGAKPTAANPVVARFAFWADDETSKLNVNTAAGGVAWDVPRAAGSSDRQYGRFQPLRNEFQRYPGHPATTSLAPVIFPNRPRAGSRRYDIYAAEALYDLVPRIQSGGTMGGTYAGKGGRDEVFERIEVDRDRLYATIDEFIFRAPDKRDKASASFERSEQRKLSGWGALDPDFLAKAQFFLTATSRAPELTVFNTPRISVWPTYADTESQPERRWSMYDHQIRFCAEIGASEGNPDQKAQYHFQRANSASSLYDYSNIERNQEIYAYLQVLMKTRIPGLDSSDGVRDHGSFVRKYGQHDSDQILTEVFDYIRSINLHDDLMLRQHEHDAWTPGGEKQARYGYTGFDEYAKDHHAYTNGRVKSARTTNDGFDVYGEKSHPGHGQVAPIEINTSGGPTKGFGRFFSVHEVGVALLTCAQANKPGWAKAYPGGVQVSRVGKKSGTNDSWSIFPGSDEDPGADYSNVPPLLDTSKATVAAVFKLNEFMVGGVPADATWLDSDKKLDGDPRGDRALTGRQFYQYVRDPDHWNRTLPQGKPLALGESRVQAVLLFSLMCPGKGWTLVNPDFRMKVNLDGDFTLGGKPLHLDQDDVWITPHSTFRDIWGMREYGGLLEPRCFLTGQLEHRTNANNRFRLGPRFATVVYDPATDSASESAGGGGKNLDKLGDWQERKGVGGIKTGGPRDNVNVGSNNPWEPVLDLNRSVMKYPWIGAPVTVTGVPGGGDTVSFGGATVEVRIYPDGGYGSDAQAENQGDDAYSQRAVIEFQDTKVPVPRLAGAMGGERTEVRRDVFKIQDGNQGTQLRPGDGWTWHRDGAFTAKDGALKGRGRLFAVTRSPSRQGAVVRGSDVTRSYVIDQGDDRIVFPKRDVGTANGEFVPHRDYGNSSQRIASNFTTGVSNNDYGRETVPQDEDHVHQFAKKANAPKGKRPQLPDNFDYQKERWGDWDNSHALELDGPYINKPDEGNAMGVAFDDYHPKPWLDFKQRNWIPYFTDPGLQEPGGPALFSPNRIMPGPGMFGSLPTGVWGDGPNDSGAQPWRTLLFRRIPGSEAGSLQGKSYKTGEVHLGWEHPRDHYLLDFFWMPVVEPYSISEPLATAGKINVNYAIQPFGYIKRMTGLRGIFSSEEILTVPNYYGASYKAGNGYGKGYNSKRDSGGDLRDTSLRGWINLLETLKQFEMVMNAPDDPDEKGKGQIFRTASQICEHWLVPERVQGNPYKGVRPTLNNVAKLFDPESPSGFGLVGDNSRERPYTNLVARLTTKSNTFNVHYRAQILRQSPLSPMRPGERRSDQEYETFNTSSDEVVSEYRGSTMIERYIDPNDKRIPDFAAMAKSGQLNPNTLTNPEFETLDKFYRFRILSEKRFAP